jgi:hypothetical protein
MPEHEAPDYERCSVCGRTALRGERLWDYVTSSGEPRRVCALCKSQAEAAHWLPAEIAAARGHSPEARPSRARALRERLARVAESARARPDEGGEAARGEASQPGRRRIRLERRPPRRREAADDAWGDTARERQAPRRPTSPAPTAAPDQPHRAARRAIERFNSSEARRTVAGLMRALGEPQASIQLGNGDGQATVTVAWELSWYQWAIEPGDHGDVREVSKGKEIDELSADARRWNGRVADDGTLRLLAA